MTEKQTRAADGVETADTETANAEAPDAYEQLLDRVERLSYLRNASSVLRWDQQVMMPEGGAPARAKQSSALSAVTHDVLTDEETGELLDELDDADLTPDQQAVVRETRRRYEQETRVPGELVEELTRTSSEAQQVWQQAKADDEFDAFAPTLETIRDLHVERAEHIDSDRDPYQVMFEGFDPYLPLDRVEEVFDDLREALVPLIEDLRSADAELADPFEGEWDEDTQMALNREAVERLGYDFERGRLDTSPHPFTNGNQFDCRITTRFKPTEPFDALMATIHEHGHASYQLGLPQEHYGTPLGQARWEIHESQSRFWENHVGRTRAFWEYFTPTLNDHLGPDLSPREAYEAANQIYPNNLIRVEADELTYHLHIILRTEVEKQFIGGDIGIDEIPQVWNDKMDKYLGVRPDTDTKGCLQDIHWTSGFAGFQSYTVGSVLAAQLDATMREDLDADVDELIREGEFEPLLDWMNENVHRHGQRYPTDELIEHVTGEPLTADYFIEYAEEKFGELYGV
ncbi:carboxypeptidase [Halobacteriales archaeon SW_6_65_15]|nr:MAG: carboxypeptidase [Halobacteriales archaeon SW_6_65_15]